MRNYTSYETDLAVNDMRARVTRAFATLRRQGLIARQNFSCCGSCAGYEIVTDAVAMVGRGRAVNGCVYYHRQSAERFYTGGVLFLSYGPLESTERGTIGLPAEQIGSMVMAALQAEGLAPTWNGDPARCIELDPQEHAARMHEAREAARASA